MDLMKYMEFWWGQQDLLTQTILIVFVCVALFQILYYWIVFGKVAFYNVKKNTRQLHAFPSVSVIIIAQNDYINLRKNLTAILEQDYPDYEVIVVNSSTEETNSMYFLMSTHAQYPHLKHIELPDVRTFYARKKFLQAIATKEASKELFLFTNTDCQPTSNQWIKEMVAGMGKEKEIVLGYSGPVAGKGFANKFYRLDNLLVSMNYLSFARMGMPYTGNGNNLGYSRALFNRANGFVSHYSVPVGEDALFVNKNALKRNCSVILTPNSFIRIQSKMNFQRWMRNKKTARLCQKHYRMGQRFVLSLFPFTRFVFYITFITLLCLLPLDVFYYSIIGVFVLRLISQLVITGQAMKKFSEKGFLFLTPLLEPVNIFLSWIVFLKAAFGRKITT